MSSSTNDISERTIAARREAEQLKEKIKQKKETLADTTCNVLHTHATWKTFYILTF
jgi:hypothetical protein